MDLAKNFGKKLVLIRQAQDTTQLQLALNADIDRSYVGRIERGEVNITLDILYKLAKTLDCDPVDLLP